MRSSTRASHHALVSLLALAPLALGACGSSGNGPVGPVFDTDGGDAPPASTGGQDAGGDVARDHVPDARPDHHTQGHSTGADAGHDAGTGHDAHHAEGGKHHDAGHDATGPGDAAEAGQSSGTTGMSTSSPSGSTQSTRTSGTTASGATGGTDGGVGLDAPVDRYVPTVDASVCPNGMGTIALVGGTANIAFGAASINGQAWQLTPFGGNSVDSTPAITPYGNGFLSLFSNSVTTDIKSAVWNGGSHAWEQVTAVPATLGPATELGSPALAVLGPNAELVYQGSTMEYYHGVYSGGTWGPAGDPVGGSTVQDIGAGPPGSAAAGGTLYAAYDGTNNGLYVDTWTPAGGWAGPQPITGAGVGGVPPTMVALTGGSADVMMVYVELTTNFLKSTVHTASGWSAPVQVSSAALGSTAVSLAPMPGGAVVMVYEGTDGFPYGSTYDASSSTWTTPVSVYPSSLPLQSPPTVAPGVCGVDAVAALVETAGVEIVTLSGGVWSPPVLVNGTAQMVYASIATSLTIGPPPVDGGNPHDSGVDATTRMDSGHAGHDSGVDATMHMDSGHDGGHIEDVNPAEAASDASTTFDCPTRTGTVALVGGSSIYAYGATSKGGGAWKVQALGTDTVGAAASVVAYPNKDFLGLFPQSLSQYLESTAFTNAWSAPSGLAIAVDGATNGANSNGAPSLAVLGANVELVYQGEDNKFYHAEYAGGAWGTASDPVGGATSQDYGPSQPTAASAAGVLFAAYDGSNNGLYVDTWTSARGWGDEVAIFGAGVGSIPPTMIPLSPSADGGGSPDLMLVFEFLNTNYIYATLHTPGGDAGDAAVGTWGPVQQINATANTFNQVSVAPLPGGGAILVYQGEDGFPYSSQYAPSAGWSAPAAVYATGSGLVSPPSVATGVCGYDAIAALVEPNGVQVTTLTAGVWSTPALVAGLSGMSFASVAVQP